MKRSEKSKNLKRKVISLMLSFLFIFSTFAFAGCEDIVDQTTGETTSFLEQYIDGFKVVYANSETEGESNLTPLDNSFFEDLISNTKGLLCYYGNAYDTICNPENDNDYNYWFPDSINQLVIKNTSTSKAEVVENKSWNWTVNFANNVSPVADENYDTWKARLWNNIDQTKRFTTDYSTYYNNMYILPLKIVMYEILIGYDYSDLTTFSSNGLEVTIASSPKGNLTTGIKVSDQTTNSANYTTLTPGEFSNSTIVDYIGQLETQYLATAKYIGFTKANADNMITYILDEVIGEDLVAYDYNAYKDTVNYRDYINRVAEMVCALTYDGKSTDWKYEYQVGGTPVTYDFIAEEGDWTPAGALAAVPDAGAIYAKPATYLKDYEGESFVSTTAKEGEYVFALENSPKAEYQSVVLMVSDEFEMSGGMVFNIMAYDVDLQIRVYARYYDKVTNTAYVFNSTTVTFDESGAETDPKLGALGYMSDFEVGYDEDVLPEDLMIEKNVGGSSQPTKMFVIDEFENPAPITSSTQLDLYENNEANSYYKIVDSANGYGGLTILDESKMNCSFYEIVFDVVKSVDDPADMDYDFKTAIAFVL